MTMMTRKHTKAHIATEKHIVITYCVTDGKKILMDRHDNKEGKNIYFPIFFVSLFCNTTFKNY